MLSSKSRTGAATYLAAGALLGVVGATALRCAVRRCATAAVAGKEHAATSSAVLPRRAPLSLADIEDLDPCKCGFSRPIKPEDREKLHTSVGEMAAHLFISSPVPASAWDAEIAKTPGHEVQNAISSAVKEAKQRIRGVRTTMFHVPVSLDRTGPPSCTVLWFPKMVKFEVTVAQIPILLRCLEDRSIAPAELGGLPVSRITVPTHIFVCAHKKKDDRCGYCGPVLMHELEQELKRQGLEGAARVHAVSHIGGHKYAGNVLIYGTERLDWYGLVTPSDVPELVRACVAVNSWVPRLWRGAANQTPEVRLSRIQEAEAASKAAQE